MRLIIEYGFLMRYNAMIEVTEKKFFFYCKKYIEGDEFETFGLENRNISFL